MKISCTNEEKETLTESIVESSMCPFPLYINCRTWLCNREDCIKCVNKNIEWEIRDGD